MLPTSFHIPAAFLLFAGGLLACFAGYRLFRVVLGVHGFILGAFVASSLVSPASTNAMIVAVLVGGVIGAVLLTLGYFVGLTVLGGGLGVMLAHVLWTQSGWGNPAVVPVLVSAVVGAVAAVFLQRYVIIAGTAFGGAWTALVGGLAMIGSSVVAQTPQPTSVWSVTPFHPTSRGWMTLAWLIAGTLGVVAQRRSKKKK